MKHIFLAWSFLVFAPAFAAAEPNDFARIPPAALRDSWWMYGEFHPFERQVRGIPVKALRAGWCKATEFRKDLFPAGPASDLAQSDWSFSVDGVFDGSKINQTALIGEYETCRGERSSFLLILSRPKGKPPVIRYVHEMPAQKFGLLMVSSDSTIHVFHCMECDHETDFKWDKSKRRFVQLPPPDDY